VTRRERIEQGIYVRHAKGCQSLSCARCNCEPSYMARAWSAAAGREVRRSFKRKADAKAWRARMMAGHADRVAGATRSPVLDVIAEQVLDAMRDGTLRNRSGDTYKPSVARSYRSNYDVNVAPLLGGRRISTITRRDVQVVVDDPRAKVFTAPKSRAGVRTVPIVKALRVHLLEHRMLTGSRDGLMFARADGRPFSPESLTKRHLMPGARDVAAQLMDTYIAQETV
jgi:hypothetical protein